MHKLGVIPVDDDFKDRVLSVESNHMKNLEIYKDLENIINQETFDMKIDNTEKKQTIIVMKEENDKILSMSLYKYIELFSDTPFYVCNVTDEEYQKMIKQIKDTHYLDERVARIKPDYNRFRYLMASDLENNIIRISNYNSNAEKGSYYINEYENLKYDENMYQFYKDPAFSRKVKGIKIYTTETYEDIINSYKKNENIHIDNKCLVKNK